MTRLGYNWFVIWSSAGCCGEYNESCTWKKRETF